MSGQKSRYLWTFFVFLAALLVRLIYFYQIKANFPGWDTPTIDPLYHDLWARQIASGNIWGSGPFFRAPFYGYLLGLIYAVFGPSMEAAKIIQHFIGAITCAVIFLFSDKYFGRKIAILAGLLAAFNWVLVYHEDELLLDSLLVLFSVILIWALMNAGETRSGRWFVVSGHLLGLASITRPNYLACLPIILLWLILLYKNYRFAIKPFVLVVLGSAVFILPVAARNYFIGHDKVLIASQGGINFYIGNNPQADGASAVMPEFGATWQYSDAEYQAKVEMGKLGQELKQSEISSFYYKKGFDYILKDFGGWLRLSLKKFILFWNAFEISNNQNLYFFRRFASVTTILPPEFFVIAPFSLLGLYFLFRMERKFHIIGYFVVVYMLTVVSFFVNSRFRLPVLPLLIILASLAFWKAWDYMKTANAKTKAVIICSLVILAALTNVDFYGVSNESYAMSHFSLGNVFLKKGMQEKALEEYAQALSMADCVPKAHLNRGVIFFSRGDYEKAEDEFRLELTKCHVTAEAYNNLSVLERLRGNPAEALGLAGQAVALKPQYLEAHINEILALRLLGETDRALAKADSLSLRFPDYEPGHYIRGQILSEQGRYDQAEKEFQIVIKSRPVDIVERYDLSTIYASQSGYGLSQEKVNGLANYEMGLLEVKRGQPASALPYFEKASEILPNYAEAWANLALAYDHQAKYPEALRAFGKAIALDPTNAITYFNCGLTLGKTGRLSDAAQFFQQALDLKPNFPEAEEKLNLAKSIIESSGQK